jgi:hypothetical protein
MTGLVVFITVTNLGLGYLLGLLTLKMIAGQRRNVASSVANCNQPVNELTTQPTESADPSLAVNRPAVNGQGIDLQHAAADRPGAPSAARTAATWDAPHSWSTLEQQVGTLNDRVCYARAADDKRLAKEVAGQLRESAHCWYCRIQAHLDGASKATPTNPAARGADMDCYEMCQSQLETTLSNIDSLDWSMTTAAILHRLDREISALKDILARMHRTNPDAALCILTSISAAQPLAQSRHGT